MATTIAVDAATRNRLEAHKRKLGVPTLNEALGDVLRSSERPLSTSGDAVLATILRKRAALVRYAGQKGIRRLAVFGSVVRGEARPDSDLDVVVEFEPRRVPGLLGLAGIELDLSELLGVPVDLSTAGSLKRMRETIEREAIDVL